MNLFLFASSPAGYCKFRNYCDVFIIAKIATGLESQKFKLAFLILSVVFYYKFEEVAIIKLAFSLKIIKSQ